MKRIIAKKSIAKPVKPVLYENPEFLASQEGLLRPGGLELTAKALYLSGLAKGAKILDVGCGCGTAVNFLSPSYNCQGLDSSAVLVAKAKKENLPVRLGSVYNLPYQNQSFAGVLAECTLSLFAEKAKALKEISRVLEAKGMLMVSDLYLREGAGFIGLPLVTCLNGLKTKASVQADLAKAGFKLVAWEDETLLFKGFLAGLIMNYGSMDSFWQSITGSCKEACEVKAKLKEVKIGYYLAVWQKEN